MSLDSKLDFKEHIQNLLNSVSKMNGLLRKLDVSFYPKLEYIQYNTALATTRATRGTSIEKLYYELGFASLESRRWHR